MPGVSLRPNLKGSRGDPDAYRRWLSETLREDVDLFENQIRYLLQIRKLKDQVFQEQRVTVTEEEMRQEFLSKRDDYLKQVERKKKYQALKQGVKQLKKVVHHRAASKTKQG